MRGERNLQKTIGNSIPPRKKTFTGKESNMSVKSDIDKLKISVSFTDFRFFFHRIRRTRQFPDTASRNVNTYKPSLTYFSVSVTLEKFVGWLIAFVTTQFETFKLSLNDIQIFR